MRVKYTERSGYTFIPANSHFDIAFVSTSKLSNTIPNFINDETHSQISVTKIGSSNPEVFAYDRQVAGRDRRSFMDEFVNVDNFVGFYAKHLISGNVQGFGMATEAGHECTRIGPLYAESLSIALLIVENLLATEFVFQDKTVSFDIPGFKNEFFTFMKDIVGCEKIIEADFSATGYYEHLYDESRIFAFTGHFGQLDC